MVYWNMSIGKQYIESDINKMIKIIKIITMDFNESQWIPMDPNGSKLIPIETNGPNGSK